MPLRLDYDYPQSIGRVKAFLGNYGMMLRALAYILTHGYDGLREATEAAVLNARYIAHGLVSDYEKPFEAPPMHFALLREYVRNELGQDPEVIFRSFETAAFAAAFQAL